MSIANTRSEIVIGIALIVITVLAITLTVAKIDQDRADARHLICYSGGITVIDAYVTDAGFRGWEDIKTGTLYGVTGMSDCVLIIEQGE